MRPYITDPAHDVLTIPGGRTLSFTESMEQTFLLYVVLFWCRTLSYNVHCVWRTRECSVCSTNKKRNSRPCACLL